jgi:hypothetical protein
VTLTQREMGEPSLIIGKRYLLIVDASLDRLATLPFGGAGVWLIGQDGNTLSPITKSPHPLTDDMNRESFRSISNLVNWLIHRR